MNGQVTSLGEAVRKAKGLGKFQCFFGYVFHLCHLI